MRLSLILLFISIVGISCVEELIFPVEPIISNPSAVIFLQDSSEVLGLSFSFTDGDGDVGYKTEERTGPPNIYITYQEKQNGKYEYLTVPILNAQNEIIGFDTVNYNSRLPYANTDGSKKSIQGDITINDINLESRTSDTVRFEFYIVDRAGNQSNVLMVEDVAFPN
jgi:hypothetical protein